LCPLAAIALHARDASALAAPGGDAGPLARAGL
jgi:hypothetical protein